MPYFYKTDTGKTNANCQTKNNSHIYTNNMFITFLILAETVNPSEAFVSDKISYFIAFT